MSTIILFPGLGASEKLFNAIDFGNRKKIVTKFLAPEENETLHQYCQRLAVSIPRNEDLIFIGVSFGGILAQEIAVFLSPQKIILISSIKSANEKPAYFSLMKIFPVYKMLPASLLKALILMLSNWLSPKSAGDNQLFRSLVREADTSMIRWGIQQTLFWRPKKGLQNIIHIHGSKDMVFPLRNVKADFVINNGKHFMIIERAKEINALLLQLLSEQMS